MTTVIDANVLFSALIKDSVKRKLILEYKGKFLMPEYALEELHNYRSYLIRKSGLHDAGFDELLDLLLSKIHIVRKDELLKHVEEAALLIADIDPYDIEFIACCLAKPGSILWSDDKKLKQQKKILVLNTEEFMKVPD